MILLQLSDFIDGKYNIPAASSTISANNSEVQAYIDDHEKNYIYKLLGIELGGLIIEYIAAGSTGNTYYDKIIGPFADANLLLCNNQAQSLGLKPYLQACIFYEYTKDSYTESLAGTVKPAAEVATDVNASSKLRKAERVFNSMLGTIESIQEVCRRDKTNYAGYAGVRMPVKGHQFFL